LARVTSQAPTRPIRLAAVALPRATGRRRFKDRALGAERDDLAAVECRHQPELVDPGVGPVGINAEQLQIRPPVPYYDAQR